MFSLLEFQNSSHAPPPVSLPPASPYWLLFCISTELYLFFQNLRQLKSPRRCLVAENWIWFVFQRMLWNSSCYRHIVDLGFTEFEFDSMQANSILLHSTFFVFWFSSWHSRRFSWRQTMTKMADTATNQVVKFQNLTFLCYLNSYYLESEKSR